VQRSQRSQQQAVIQALSPELHGPQGLAAERELMFR
jgi:hypothetical protein